MMMTNEFSDKIKQVDIEAFLIEFDNKCASFRMHCEQYMRKEINIGDITKHLSEATADAEMFFAEHSFYMAIEQLQRYGSIQKVFDNLTFQLFETEIERNRAVILDALLNGDYFIINLMFNSIKSSYYMMYSKHKIKTEQNQKLAELEREFEATQAIVKVLKAFEGVIQPEDADQLDLIKIQKILQIYISHFSQLDQMRTRIACDRRLFLLFKNHQDFLACQDLNSDDILQHLLLCCHIIEPLAQDHEDLQAIWQGWRNELTARLWKQTPDGFTQSEAASPEFEDRAPLILKILDNIEAATRPAEATLLDYHTIQLELKNYVEMMGRVGLHSDSSVWDDRVFNLLEEHVDFLDSIDFGGAPVIVAKHLSDCCDLLQSRAQKPLQQHMLEAWRGISSTIFVNHSERVGKNKLAISDQLNAKRQQELQWASIERELEAGKVLIQALNGLENVLSVESVEPLNFQMIQKALQHYTEVIRTQDSTTPTRRVCDERLFNLFGEYVDLLYAHQTIVNMAILAAHINTCINLLKSVAQDQVQWQMLIVWRSLKDDLLNKFAVYTKQKQVEKQSSLAILPVKVARESAETPTEDEFEAQALLKMLDVLDSLMSVEHTAHLDYSAIQQALKRYVAASNVLGTPSLRSTCHEKIFSLFEAHVDFLYESGFMVHPEQSSAHLMACCNLLDIIAENKMQLQMLSVWRSL